jgi:hypothetical protein
MSKGAVDGSRWIQLGLLTIVGPLLLVLVSWAGRSLKNRKSKGDRAHRAATHELYQEEERAHRAATTRQNCLLTPDACPPPHRRLVRGQRLGAAPAPARDARRGARGRNALLVAPTGAGKTLAGLPAERWRVELIERARADGLHTLYVSPLKALAVDVQRNLLTPIEEMGLDIRVETRTGDTPPTARRGSGCGRRRSC